MTSPFDIVKHINEKTELEFDIKEYNAWIINKAFSFMRDTVYYANAANTMAHLDKDIQYKFYLNCVPKGKRFGKWQKQSKPSEIVEMLCDLYSINKRVAETYVSLLSEDDLQQLQEKVMKGGKK